MLEIESTNSFLRDLKRYKHNNRALSDLQNTVELLSMNQVLPKKYSVHKLIGNFKNKWECHISPDLLLIYDFNDSQLFLIRLGTHSELFG
jgi:mRNA interferase YafQ